MKSLALIRSIFVTFLFPFTVLILGPIAMLGHYLFHRRKLDDYILSLWGRICCRMSGVKVVVEGQHNIPEEGCLFLFNHTSFFDIFAMCGYIPKVRFGAKSELFKIPVFSQTMKAMNVLPIARNKPNEVFKIYEEAKNRFGTGEQFALSPEGGRFYGQQLSPFKSGPFIFAMSAGAPVVPVVIIGANTALPKGGILFNKSKLFHTIYLKILEPIDTKKYTPDQDSRKDLQKVVYDKMNSVWTQEESFANS